MDIHHFLIFVSIAFFYLISPGPAVFLAINYGAVHGFKKTAMVLLGNSTGLIILATASALGLGALIVQSFILLTAIKIVGAMVLFYLGCKMLLSVRASKNTATSENASQQKHDMVGDNYASFYKKGLFLALSNPKAIIFFTAIFPQFMSHDNTVQNNFITMMILGLTFSVMSFICMNTYNILGQKVLARFLNATGIKIMNLVSGAVFITMSGMLAFSDLGQKQR